jgi:branched-subunit amino acid transport protein AzlD
MTGTWIAVGAVAVICALMRVAAPLLLGERRPARLISALELTVPALLAALIVTQTFGAGNHLVIDPRLAGVAAGGLVALARKPLLLALLVAVATTAGVRALT